MASRDRNALSSAIYEQCIGAADRLAAGDAGRFAEKAAELFGQVHSLVAQACRRLGCWDAAMRVYDGASLWK